MVYTSLFKSKAYLKTVLFP